MPYKIKLDRGEYVVFNPDTGKVYGRHASAEKARRQQAALYANAPPDEEKKRKGGK